MTTTRHGWTTPGIGLAALLALVCAPLAVAGDCYRAEVREAIGLPDGTTAAGGGSVTVCRVRTISPVSVLHSLKINGRDQGLFLGTKQRVEAEGAGRPTFIFARNDSQALELRAVAYGADGRFAAWRADRIGRGTTPRVRTRGAFDLAARDGGGQGSLVLIAAAD